LVYNFPVVGPRCHAITPQPSTSRFSSWWCKAMKEVLKEGQERAYYLIILVAWKIWNHRNNCVFNGANPYISIVLQIESAEPK
jgi:hypothetical protein